MKYVPIYQVEETDPNIMFDPRVMRGSNFSQHNRNTLVALTLPALVPPSKDAEGSRERESAAKKKLQWRAKSIYDYRAPPPKGAGSVDLSAHLVERETKVRVDEADCQVSYFLM